VNRRRFLKNTSLAAAAVNLARGAALAGESVVGADLIDTNVYLSRWPFRRVWADDTANLVSKLKEHHVTTALAASFDGVFHKDVSAANEQVVGECANRGQGILQPVGSINPTLPDWEEDFRRCHEVHRMRAIRVYPNYHRYSLDDPRFARVVELAASSGVVLQVPLQLEDERTQPPLMQVSRVNPEPLVGLLKLHPAARVMLLNCFPGLRNNRVLLGRLISTRQIAFDIATLELMGGVEQLLNEHREIRLLFGSYAPFYYFESAALKLKESVLTPAQLKMIQSEQATRMLGLA
jgi:predicted TIM-barrel fold metal-dependent hydrolase